MTIRRSEAEQVSNLISVCWHSLERIPRSVSHRIRSPHQIPSEWKCADAWLRVIVSLPQPSSKSSPCRVKGVKMAQPNQKFVELPWGCGTAEYLRARTGHGLPPQDVSMATVR